MTAINCSILTGILTSDPEPARSPAGDPVTLLGVAFQVADPAPAQTGWSWAGCEVEVPCDLAAQVEGLSAGDEVLVAGQLSERQTVETGPFGWRSVIVASRVRSAVNYAPIRTDREEVRR